MCIRDSYGECLKPEFKTYAQQVVDNSKALAEALMAGGLTLVSGGTDNHLCLVDVAASLDLGGKDAEAALGNCEITVNKNMIAFDPRTPMDPSGVRIGTPALTTRGMGVDQMTQIGQWIVEALKNANDESVHASIKSGVKEMCDSFPVPAASMLV